MIEIRVSGFRFWSNVIYITLIQNNSRSTIRQNDQKKNILFKNFKLFNSIMLIWKTGERHSSASVIPDKKGIILYLIFYPSKQALNPQQQKSCLKNCFDNEVVVVVVVSRFLADRQIGFWCMFWAAIFSGLW